MLDTALEPADSMVVTTNWLAFIRSMKAWSVAGSLPPLQTLVKVGECTDLDTSEK